MSKPLLAGALCLLCAMPIEADPLYAKDLSPLGGLFGFPTLRNARALGAGQFTAAVHGNVANNYSVDQTSDERVNLDVETRRLAFRAPYGLGGGWEMEAEVPWLRHEGGDLDKLIEKWHSFWNLPDGNRDDAPRDLVNVRYAGPGADFALEDEVEGWGDIHLAAVKTVWATDSAAVSARAGVKLGTGDEKDLIGSGSEDYYLSLNFSGDHRGKAPVLWHGQLGYLRAGDADVLGGIQEKDLWFAGLGMEWRARETLHVKLQVDSHSAVANSSLTQLGDVSVQITAGLSWLFAEGLEGEFSFSEDIAVDTAPDFVLQLGIRYRGSAK